MNWTKSLHLGGSEKEHLSKKALNLSWNAWSYRALCQKFTLLKYKSIYQSVLLEMYFSCKQVITILISLLKV